MPYTQKLKILQRFLFFVKTSYISSKPSMFDHTVSFNDTHYKPLRYLMEKLQIVITFWFSFLFYIVIALRVQWSILLSTRTKKVCKSLYVKADPTLYERRPIQNLSRDLFLEHNKRYVFLNFVWKILLTFT